MRRESKGERIKDVDESEAGDRIGGFARLQQGTSEPCHGAARAVHDRNCTRSSCSAYLKALHRPGITSLRFVTISWAHCSETFTRRPKDNKAAHRTDDMPSCSNGSMSCNAPSEYRASAFCKASKRTDKTRRENPISTSATYPAHQRHYRLYYVLISIPAAPTSL